ncbi:MAG: hypothetical protein ACR2JB_14445 [Bryobacteraceae bacterium]
MGVLRDSDLGPLEPRPEPDAREFAASIAKIAISTIPVFGGPAAELFGTLVGPILERRRNQWFEELRLLLDDLMRKIDGLTLQSLSHNEDFVSATMQATSMALRTHAREKLEALQNAVLNVAGGSAPDDDLQSIFLSLVDSLSPLHLRLLKQFKQQTPVRIADAPQWLKADTCIQAAKELLDRGLIGMPSQLVPNRDRLIIGDNGVYTFRAGLTALGNRFLAFITAPPGPTC